jgi:hypothetical protein
MNVFTDLNIPVHFFDQFLFEESNIDKLKKGFKAFSKKSIKDRYYYTFKDQMLVRVGFNEECADVLLTEDLFNEKFVILFGQIDDNKIELLLPPRPQSITLSGTTITVPPPTSAPLFPYCPITC